MHDSIKTTLWSALLLFSFNASAAFITINESAIDNIFSQSNFGNSIVDIRIGSTTELVFPELLNINNEVSLRQLFSQHLQPFNAVSLFFVDSINWCGGFNTSIVGCGEYRGNDYAVESLQAASSNGSELLAHELGHNLGLGHTTSPSLMSSSLNGNTFLSVSQVEQVLRSPLVQQQNDYRWIDVNPILIVSQAAQVVSEPSTLVLLAGALMLLFRRKIALHVAAIKR